MPETKITLSTPLRLEGGGVIEQAEALVWSNQPLGAANAKPVVWIIHALTANADASSWWADLVGNKALFNPTDYLVIGVNILGSCYGSSGPLSINPYSKQPYYHDFPQISVRDMATFQYQVMQALNIEEVEVLIGASLGGQQALELALLLKNKLQKLVLIATNAKHSAWGKAFNEAQRMAIETDVSWGKPIAHSGLNGLKAARATAMLSYRTYRGYNNTQIDADDALRAFKAASYQKYQGEKLAKRFNAIAYHRLSSAMDSHHVGRNRGGIERALATITADTMVIGISSDLLFPIEEQKVLARQIPNAALAIIDSVYGHDGFLIEGEKLKQILAPFLQNQLLWRQSIIPASEIGYELFSIH